MEKKAVLTFDLEYWYNSNFLGGPLIDNADFSPIKKSLDIILELLESRGQKATFFVLGQLAQEHPGEVARIYQAGHEIACHGYSHRKLNDLDSKSFAKELAEAKTILKNIIKKEITGFRAPNFSLNKKTSWAINVLKRLGFKYDSSVHPLKRNLFFKEFLEVPPSLGGIYFRILPLPIFLFASRILLKTNIPVFYFHPHEFFEFVPKIEHGPWYKRKIKYWGIKTAWKKFEKLNKKFNFVSIEQHLKKI